MTVFERFAVNDASRRFSAHELHEKSLKDCSKTSEARLAKWSKAGV